MTSYIVIWMTALTQIQLCKPGRSIRWRTSTEVPTVPRSYEVKAFLGCSKATPQSWAPVGIMDSVTTFEYNYAGNIGRHFETAGPLSWALEAV